ncbi:hypothetical protein SH668x_003700 [Planctomicrobium sp. SH668]|uniref:hypothetical protein n=1 Tax=Planctomicrobium sp. SH668 TaxID=3448126 RepID=UPI003F5AE2A9
MGNSVDDNNPYSDEQPVLQGLHNKRAELQQALEGVKAGEVVRPEEVPLLHAREAELSKRISHLHDRRVTMNGTVSLHKESVERALERVFSCRNWVSEYEDALRMPKPGTREALEEGLAIQKQKLAAAQKAFEDEAERHRELRDSYTPVLERESKELALLESERIELAGKLDPEKQENSKRHYELMVQYILTDHALTAADLMDSAARQQGTTLEAMLASPELRASATPFTYGTLSRTALEQALHWGQEHEAKGDPRKNLALSAEERAFKQFLNQDVIPNFDYFQILASKVDDLQQADTDDYRPLEILGQKPLSLSGRRKLPEAPEQKQSDATKWAENNTQPVDYGAVLSRNLPIQERLQTALDLSNAQLQHFEGLFQGVQDRIERLEAEGLAKKKDVDSLQARVRDGEAQNRRLDERIVNTEETIEITKKINARKTTAAYIGGKVASSSIRSGAQQAGLILGGAIFAGGAMTGIGTLLLPMLVGLGTGVTSAAAGEVAAQYQGQEQQEDAARLAIREEFLAHLKSQKVNVAEHRQEIDKILDDIKTIVEQHEFQPYCQDALTIARTRQAYLARFCLQSGNQNTQNLQDACELSGAESVDTLLGILRGRLGTAMEHFCLGIANTGDMEVILAESNALPRTGQLGPAQEALRDFVDSTLKPNIGSYLSKAAKIDVIQQANLLPYGSQLHWAREMVRDETDKAVRALFANEFGMSIVGVQDVKHVFDFYLHRHGDRKLYDTKLRDGQPSPSTTRPKRINAFPKEHMEGFTDDAKHFMEHRSAQQPTVGDTFLRVCGYEYYLPQAVKTAGVNNIFSENPEAPAAYPMANDVINRFVQQMSFSSVEEYREKVGERLDNLIASTFFDFFAELGQLHDKNPKVQQFRERLKAGITTGDYGAVFDNYVKLITRDAMNRYDLFLDIYKMNLEKQLQVSTDADRRLIEQQIHKLDEEPKRILNPAIIKPGSHEARFRASLEEHYLENTSERRGR